MFGTGESAQMSTALTASRTGIGDEIRERGLVLRNDSLQDLVTWILLAGRRHKSENIRLKP
jgi:hypothetical protein